MSNVPDSGLAGSEESGRKDGTKLSHGKRVGSNSMERIGLETVRKAKIGRI